MADGDATNDRRKGRRDPTTNPNLCGHYGHKSNGGGLCRALILTGLKACKRHCGISLAKAKAKGAIVMEVRRWGLGDTTVDPGETLLRLVSQSAARVEMYSRLLQDAFDAAERLRQAQETPQSDLLAAETARMDLERVFNIGGVGVLIGHTYAGTQTSGVIATGERIRGIADLEAQERDRCANFAKLAIAAGLAERQVRIAERQGAMVAGMFAEFARALGHDPDDPAVRSLVVGVIARHAGVAQIEGVAA